MTLLLQMLMIATSVAGLRVSLQNTQQTCSTLQTLLLSSETLTEIHHGDLKIYSLISLGLLIQTRECVNKTLFIHRIILMINIRFKSE